METNFYSTATWNILLYTLHYLVCLFFIIHGIRGLKSGLDIVGEEMPSWVFKGGILIGFIMLIATSSSNSREIAIKMLGNYAEAHLAVYISTIVSAFVTSVTAFFAYLYWRKYVPKKIKEKEHN